MPETTNYSNTDPHHQGWDHDEQLTIAATGTVHDVPVRIHSEARIRIHHDTSHAMQSWARAEVWSAGDLRWNEVATVQWQVWATDPFYSNGGGTAPDGLWEARDELLARVRHLLG